MEPIKPKDRAAILQQNPEADPADIEEYEQLLSQRFTRDPSLPEAPPDAMSDTSPSAARKARLKELRQKLFLHKDAE